MNAVLEALYRTGTCETLDGKPIKVHAGLSREQSQFIADLIDGLGAAQLQTLEVGLAFGLSALTICEAIRNRPGSRHVAMDPVQTLPHERRWNGAGLRNLEAAGFRGMVDFYEEPSQMVLPRLVADNRKFDFAFIDGSHCSTTPSWTFTSSTG